jgi:hypothetical protein
VEEVKEVQEVKEVEEGRREIGNSKLETRHRRETRNTKFAAEKDLTQRTLRLENRGRKEETDYAVPHASPRLGELKVAVWANS